MRRHFNCPTLEGAELEDQGIDGTAITHWEKRVFEVSSLFMYFVERDPYLMARFVLVVFFRYTESHSILI